MITQSDYTRLRKILQADRMKNSPTFGGEKYEEDIAFSILIEKAIENLVEDASS